MQTDDQHRPRRGVPKLLQADFTMKYTALAVRLLLKGHPPEHMDGEVLMYQSSCACKL